MALMLRAFAATLLCAVVMPAAAVAVGQSPGVLRVRIVLVGAGEQPTPVPNHALIISDDPPSAAPRRILTSAEGTAELRLRPGRYVVESERPVAFDGTAYAWRQVVELAAGSHAVLELTSASSEARLITAETIAGAAAPEPARPGAASLLLQWQDSVVALWTPTAHASGFVVDASGLIATSQRAIGAATSVEVQLTPAIKIAGSVLAADADRDVAIVRTDPAVLASVKPLPLECGSPPTPPLAGGQDIVTIGTPLGGPKTVTSGILDRPEGRTLTADFILPAGSVGGPVFAEDGRVIGIASIVGEDDVPSRDSRVVGIEAACGVVASARAKMAEAPPPSGAHLPVEPARLFPASASEDTARLPVDLDAYRMSSSDFEITFITPALARAARTLPQPADRRDRTGGPSAEDAERTRRLTDFGHWSDYVSDLPPVLLIRVTPKRVEGFWTRVARGAAMTQGVFLPSFEQFRTGFSRMRAFCGDTEVTPIHPFTLDMPVSETGSLDEGLYVYDPAVLGLPCGNVELALYSEQEPTKADTEQVDPKVLQRIWQDFLPR